MQVIWAGSAKRKLGEIVTRIAEDNPDAALRILAAFEESARKLGKFPKMGRTGKIAGTRELSVHKHYFIVYELSGSRVSIVSLWHTSQQYPAEIRKAD